MGRRKETQVVAAFVWRKDKFLICQRPADKARGLMWEFVGGKVEQGETKKQALVRECAEELGVTVQPLDIYIVTKHSYPDITVRLTLFNATIVEGFPQALEHNDIRWITVNEIDNYQFCPADQPILEQIKKDYTV